MPRRRIASIDGPDPIDIHVGSRLRLRRSLIGMSQSELAGHLGLTFQQVQKYEKGTNRMSCSMLWRAAEALDVPVTFFFDGLEGGIRSEVAEDPLSRELLTLLRLYNAAPEGVQSAIVKLLRSVVEIGDEEEEPRQKLAS